MATLAATTGDVLDLALRAGERGMAMRQAEALLIRRRTQPPRVGAAVNQALADATGSALPPARLVRAGAALAAAIEAHGASFPPAGEPAYHDRHHQAEAVLAMGWLTGAARRLGLLGAEEAALGVLAMAGHDLLHDGGVHPRRGLLERRSAEVAGDLAAAAGLDAGEVATLRRVILATTWPWEAREAPGLLCHLAREADLFGSSLPVLGPRLARLLAQEFAAAGQESPESVATHVARVALLRLFGPVTVPARALGLDAVRAAQLGAYAEAARRLGLQDDSAESGAAMLDVMDPQDAEALLAWSGRDGVTPE